MCASVLFSIFSSPVKTRVEEFIGLLIIIEGFGKGDGRGLDHRIGDVLHFRDDSTEADSREYVPASAEDQDTSSKKESTEFEREEHAHVIPLSWLVSLAFVLHLGEWRACNWTVLVSE